MKKSLVVALAAAPLLVFAAANKPNLRAAADLADAQGNKVGKVTLEETAHGVILTGEVNNLPAGEHAIHFHQVGKCEAPFKTAGDHFNPTGKEHGIKAAKGSHAGDLPNLVVPEGGKLKFEVFSHEVTLKKGKTSLFDKDGTAVVIHAKADDYQSAPSGNAGDRIACGVVTEAPAEEPALPGSMGGGQKDGGMM